MKITKDNLNSYGIGHNFSDPIHPNDLPYITYGNDVPGVVTTDDPTAEGGEVAYRKEPSFQRWWKIGPRGAR